MLNSTVDLLQSAYSNAATYQQPVQEAAAPAVEPVEADNADLATSARVQISYGGRLLLEYAQTQEALAANGEAPANAANFDLLARNLAYQQAALPLMDQAVSPLRSPAQAGGTARAQTQASADKPGSSQLQTRMDTVQDRRIALYEMEKARGTPATEIYRKLTAFNAAQPVPFK